MAQTRAHEGKTVLITGGGGGLGRAIVERFIELGANVVTCDINDILLADLQEKVVAASPERVLVTKCDITSEDALDELFQQTESRFGKLDYVVNSAGIMDLFDPAGSTDRDLLDKVLAVNLVAPTMITKRAVNLMIKHETKGSIVNIASVAAFKGYASGAAYTMSKHGLVGLTKNTAAFYQFKGIRCNAIQAGAMETNISSAMANGYCKEGLEFSMKHFGDWQGVYCELPKMAKLVTYLCSDDASMINGALITADGGMTAV